MCFHRKLALTFPLLLLSPVVASISNSVDNHVALTSHNLVLTNCKNFNQSDLNIEMQLMCAGSRLQLYTLKAGNQEFVTLAKNNQVDVTDNKSAVRGQYKNLNNALNIAQTKSDLLGAISVNNQVAALLSLDKEITFLKKIEQLNLTTKQITNQYAIAPNRDFSLIQEAYAEKFALSAPEELDIKDYIKMCQGDADIERDRILQVKLDDFCSPLESREIEQDGFELKTGDIKHRCQKDLLEKASSNLLQKQCAGDLQCENSPQTKQQTQKDAETKLKNLDGLEKQCFRGVKNLFSMSEMAGSILTAAVYRYIQYDQYFAEKYHDPDHANTSSLARMFTKGKYQKKESSKEESDEFIKTFTNLKYFENKMRLVVSGKEVTPLVDIPFKDNHGLPEVLTKPENANVLSSKTPGLPTNLNSGNTAKMLHRDLERVANEIEPLMIRLKNTLIYLEIENAADGVIHDNETKQLLNELGLSKSDNTSNKSSFIFFSPAVASEDKTSLADLFEAIMPVSVTTDDSSISTPQKRFVLFSALKNLTNEVKATTDKSIMDGKQDKKKLEEFLKISSANDLLFLNIFQYLMKKLIPDTYASTASSPLKLDCITSGCRPLSSILSANKDRHPIRKQLKPYVDQYTQLIDEINDKKELTPKIAQLLQQINSSKMDLDKLQNEMENEYYLHMDKIGKGSSNLAKQTDNFLTSSLLAMNFALTEKNLNLMDIKQSLFLNLSNDGNTFLNNTPPTTSSGVTTNQDKALLPPSTNNKPSGSFQESTYLGSDADKDADINPDHGSSLFENISKKYQFIYYIRPR